MFSPKKRILNPKKGISNTSFWFLCTGQPMPKKQPRPTSAPGLHQSGKIAHQYPPPRAPKLAKRFKPATGWPRSSFENRHALQYNTFAHKSRNEFPGLLLLKSKYRCNYNEVAPSLQTLFIAGCLRIIPGGLRQLVQ